MAVVVDRPTEDPTPTRTPNRRWQPATPVNSSSPLAASRLRQMLAAASSSCFRPRPRASCAATRDALLGYCESSAHGRPRPTPHGDYCNPRRTATPRASDRKGRVLTSATSDGGGAGARLRPHGPSSRSTACVALPPPPPPVVAAACAKLLPVRAGGRGVLRGDARRCSSATPSSRRAAGRPRASRSTRRLRRRRLRGLCFQAPRARAGAVPARGGAGQAGGAALCARRLAVDLRGRPLRPVPRALLPEHLRRRRAARAAVAPRDGAREQVAVRHGDPGPAAEWQPPGRVSETVRGGQEFTAHTRATFHAGYRSRSIGW